MISSNNENVHTYAMARPPIRPVALKFNVPIAAINDDITSGKIKPFNMRKNSSPKKLKYIISRADHFDEVDARKIKPTITPSTTPANVEMVSNCSKNNLINLSLLIFIFFRFFGTITIL